MEQIEKDGSSSARGSLTEASISSMSSAAQAMTIFLSQIPLLVVSTRPPP